MIAKNMKIIYFGHTLIYVLSERAKKIRLPVVVKIKEYKTSSLKSMSYEKAKVLCRRQACYQSSFL